MDAKQPQRSRRGFMLGAATVGAAAAAVVALPTVQDEPATQAEPQRAPERGGGYHVTEHVKQYYKSTLL